MKDQVSGEDPEVLQVFFSRSVRRVMRSSSLEVSVVIIAFITAKSADSDDDSSIGGTIE